MAGPLRIAADGRDVRDEPSELRAVLRDHPLEIVDASLEAEPVHRGAEGPERRDELGERGEAFGSVHVAPVRKDEERRRSLELRGQRLQPAGALGRVHREEREPLVPIEPGDDTRHPTAEASLVRVEEKWPLERLRKGADAHR
jgi:hypothetical protein